MLVPKLTLHSEFIDGEEVCSTTYRVWSEEDCGFIENRFFTHYDTREECQKAINMFNSFKIVKPA